MRSISSLRMFCFFFNDTATTEIYTLSLHDALPIYRGHDRAHDLALLVVAREADGGGDIFEVGMRRQRELRQDRDLLAWPPIRMGDLHRRPRGRVPFDLAALDRELRFGRTLVAHDDLELGTIQVVHDGRIDRDGRAGTRSREGGFVFLRVREGLDLRGLPREHDVDERIGAADPAELGGLEANALRSKLLVERNGGRADGKHRAILGRDAVDGVDRQEAAGARLVLGDDVRLAGNMLPDMAGDDPRPDVIGATGWIP